nr:hypothetical protein [Tanacetum cinerariifolium]
MDKALVPTVERLRIGRSNFRLLSDIKSKESTLQLVYDVLRIYPFFKFSALLPIELTNDEIRNFKAYKEYYAIATGKAAPKPKASVRRTKSNSDTSITPPTAAASPRLTTSAKGKQPTKASKAKSLSALSEPSGSGADEGTGSKPGVLDVPTDESEEELSWNSTDNKGDDNAKKDDDSDEEDEGDDGEEGNCNDDDEDDDRDKGEEGDNDNVDQEVVRDYDKDDEEEGGDDEHKFNEDGSDKETRDKEIFDPIPQTLENSKDEGNCEEDLSLNISEEERHIEEEEEDELYKEVNINQGRGIQASLEVEDSHVTLTLVNPDGMELIFKTTSQLDVQTHTSVAPLSITTPTMTPSTIATITTTSQALILPTTVPSNIIQNLPNFGTLFHFDNRLRSLEAKIFEAMQTNQFAGALSAVNEQLKAEVLTRSSHSSRTSYAAAADLFEMELKKILIEKIEGNKSIQRSDEQRNLYKALVDAYESDKIILDTYGETVTLKRRRDDDADKDEEPFARPDRGSKRRREGKDPESASDLMETTTRSAGRSTQGSRSRQASASESALAEEPMQTTSQMEDPSHLEFDIGADDQLIVQFSQHPEWFPPQQKPPTLDLNWNKTLPAVHESIQLWISELAKQADSRSSFNELIDTPLDFSNFLMNRLRGVAYWGRKRQQFYSFAVNWESARDMYSTRRIIAVIELKIVEWHSYKHLDWITRCVEDLQLGVKSYQKKLNLTKLDSYRSDLKHKEAYTAYSNLRGFIYQNKDKKNRLMRINELHKFSDGTLIDVRTALDDRLKGIQMQYLP